MSVVTRFAPSPTGFLHIGGARTALFNWLFARHHGGRFLLRIEDTDRLRSTAEAVDAIFSGLRWLDLMWDGEAVFQSERMPRHIAAVEALLAAGRAYRCYESAEDLAARREAAKSEGRPLREISRWRDADPSLAPSDRAHVVRFRAPDAGTTAITDLIQGEISVANENLDDMILLRSDGTPTYLLAVVVDDHDMGVTHVIRGTDHLTNAFRQYHLYRALDWNPPAFAHVPLIHGADGAKLSKRHGALGVSSYREDGFLPEALCNYLLRLGWSHGDDEIIALEDAIRWFDLPAVGRSPARFDLAKLSSLNAHYLRTMDIEALADLVEAEVRKQIGGRVVPEARARIARALPQLRLRAKTVVELAAAAAAFAINAPVPLTAQAEKLLTVPALEALEGLRPILAAVPDWRADDIEAAVRAHVSALGPDYSLKTVAQPLRASLTGATVSPPVFEVMDVLGRPETMARLDAVLETHLAARPSAQS